MSLAAKRPPLQGLYAITSEALVRDPARLLPAAEAALRGGARLLQYRDKWNPPEQRVALATALSALCRTHGAALIVNDDPALALQAGAAGAHVGVSDASLTHTRALLGSEAIVGVTCGNDLERAQAAVDGGADYIAFGRFFPSRTKPDAPPADVETLRAARARWPTLPICAIGGVTPANAHLLIDAGATLIAAIDGVFGGADIEVQARQYSGCFMRA